MLRFGRSRQPSATAFQAYDKLNFGCGYDKRAGYLNVDVDAACNPDVLVKSGDFSALPKNHFIELYAKDVLEHIPRTQTMSALLEFSSLIRPEGLLMVQTTNILELAKRMETNSSFADQYGWTVCLFGTQAHPGDFHYTGFTDTTLQVHLAAAGFSVVSRDLIDGWMNHWECVKDYAWEADANHPGDDLAFLSAAYDSALHREIDETGITHFSRELSSGKSRRNVLKDLYCAPERLYVTAQRLNL